ncbi:DUF420 domain-containing protein [Flammeovirgaceae bacterium SG7u.111]|nr:DUF420 domain-containing protein [Flammeovirgaceae bacterium SG7u.132]WPO33792.1 DUF420 domain-containing protein [Flammeovirgaceae bacterium SG7u.111]
MTVQTSTSNDKKYLWIIGVLSIAVPVLVAILLFLPNRTTPEGGWVYFLPHLHGTINSITAILLVFALYFIKNKQITYHKFCMNISFILGAIFLLSYVIYHASVEPTKYGGEGLMKGVYFFVLLTHIVLSAVVVPLVLLAFYYAWTSKFDRHKKIVKFTYPIWLYVSVTGVITYLMISPYYQY